LVIDQVAETPQSGWRLEQTAHDALEIEFPVDVNEFVSGQRGDHKRRLASPRTTAGRRLKKSISRSRSDCPTLPHFPGSEPHQGLHRSAWMRYIQ